MFANIDWTQTFAVVITGLVVVFSVLLLLVFLCWLFRVVFGAIEKKETNAKMSKQEKKAAKAELAVEKKNESAVVEDGINDDVVAAISAAIACILGENAKFSLKSVKRSRGVRPAWNAAGIAENTRPF